MPSVRSGKGDDGFTDLLFQQRISKDSPDVRAIGDLDELNSHLGLIKVKLKSKKSRELIEKIQRAICIIASEAAISEDKKRNAGNLLTSADVDWIKSIIYELEGKSDISHSFYMPGGSELSAYLDITRTVARRAERSVVALMQNEEDINKNIFSYLNCISDVLFLLARIKQEKPVKKKKKTKKNKGA